MTDVAVITGGASGFGLALGASCASHGMTVVLLDRDGDRVAGQTSLLASQYGVEVIGSAMDVGDESSVSAAAAMVTERLGRADLVISNVGVQLFGAIDQTTDAEWRWVYDVNVLGAVRVTRAFLPLLRAASPGRLAFTSSSSVFDPASRMTMYQSSKFAVWGLAESLRVELARDGIVVSVVFPSGMISRHLETSEAAQPAEVRRPIGVDDDFAAMHESNPTMADYLLTPDDAAAGVLEALLTGSPYVITHGEFDAVIDQRAAALHDAAINRT